MNELFEKIYYEYKDDVYRLAISYIHNKYDAEDIVQRTFIKVYKNIHNIKEDSNIKIYLLTITANECKDLFRSFWKRNIKMQDNEDQSVIFDGINNEIFEALKIISRKYRICIHLYYFYGYSIEEISHIENININTIKTRLTRGKQLLKKWREIMDKKYKEAFNKLHLSQDVDNKIFSKTINKKEYNPYLKKSLIATSIVLVISITTLGIVFAKEIKEVIQKYFITTITPTKDGEPLPIEYKFLEVHAFKEVNYDALLPEVDENKHDFENKPRIKLGELEVKLETRFLHFNEYENQEIILNGVEIIEYKIGKTEFQTSIKTSNNSSISIVREFVTKYTEQYKDGFSIQFSHIKGISLKEYSDKLNTDIYYNVGTTVKEDCENRLTTNSAIFVYDDVAYHLSGNNITKNMLTELIESVSLNEEED